MSRKRYLLDNLGAEFSRLRTICGCGPPWSGQAGGEFMFEQEKLAQRFLSSKKLSTFQVSDFDQFVIR